MRSLGFGNLVKSIRKQSNQNLEWYIYVLETWNPTNSSVRTHFSRIIFFKISCEILKSVRVDISVYWYNQGRSQPLVQGRSRYLTLETTTKLGAITYNTHCGWLKVYSVHKYDFLVPNLRSQHTVESGL